jgi:pimeloyl-ACP methyl ester carboxylesterase
VALTLIALVVAGLTFVRFAPSPRRVSVPAGAKAGELQMHPCHYDTEAGSHAADCGTLVVPEDRHDPQSRLLALPVTRIKARSADSGEPIFRFEGGPGLTNMRFEQASRYAEDHDVVLVGYRGVDGSSVLNCPEVSSVLKHSTDFLSTSSLRSYADAFSACAHRLQHHGTDLAGYTLSERADDVEAARVALGYGPIDLLSESAGTRTALIYSWRYPSSIHRSVMYGANPPGHFVWDSATTDEQIARYAAACAKDASCAGRTSDLAATLRQSTGDVPDRWGTLPIKKGNVRIATFFGLFDASSSAAPISAPMTFDTWLDAGHGDVSGLWMMSLAADITFPDAFRVG